ncbi:MAG TPA: oligopeptide:H+ symporter [Gemmataceae bacterium]|nr:oligopeptide:H+ symporter [Gemmataceae bacterium]
MSTTDPSWSDPERGDYAEPGVKPTTGHPPALRFMFWGEFAERSSYYGMRTILFLYLTTQFGLSDAVAGSTYSYFKAACYFLPLLGGFLADRFFGKYWTIVGFSVPYVAGQLLIGFANEYTIFLALALLAMGSGVIKPNISALLGQTYDQKRPGNSTLRANAFMWFYFSVNLGATISMALLPWVRDEYGYKPAFLIPAGLMALALLIFALGKHHYATETVGPAPPSTPEERALKWKTLKGLFGIFFLMIFFWVPYEHNDNLWIAFARDRLDLALPSWLGGKVISPDAFQWVNGALILLLVPASLWFWPKVDPTGKRFPHTTKILMGLVFTAMGPATLAVCGHIAGDGKPTFLWLMLAYLLLTVGEVLVYGTMLDLSYAYAPKSMKGFVTACFLVTNALGNMINSQYIPFYEKPHDIFGVTVAGIAPANYFLLDAGIALAAAFVFFFVGRSFNRANAVSAEAVTDENERGNG